MSKRKHKVNFYWDDERGTCRCTVSDGDNKYIGMAFCNPVDFDMKSQKTGEEIAYNRALINALKAKKKEVNNRGDNIFIDVKGVRYTVAQFAEKFHLDAKQLYAKLNQKRNEDRPKQMRFL